MSKKKILVVVLVVLALAAIVFFTIKRAEGSYTKVLVGEVQRGEVSSVVSGTGQIKPKTYVNIGATAFGRITHLYVKEGDHVHAGEVLATVESVQPAASVAAQQDAIHAAKTDIAADAAAEQNALATIQHAEADLEQKQLDYGRYKQLYAEKLVSKSDYDAKKAAYDLDVAGLAEAKASLVQAQAETASARGHLGTAVATLRSDQDALNKTVSIAPFAGTVTNLPVREGETVVVGIQNAEGSTLMTIADMSVITAEVKIDETDIVNVKLGQPVDITVDALPDVIFKGKVTEVGDQALLRSTGVATSQSTSGTEEAKDFKVVVTLNPGQNVSSLRPGLSATARILTADMKDVLYVPIQALTTPPASVDKNAEPSPFGISPQGAQGVFLLRTMKGRQRAYFVALKTGVTGTSNIEVSGPVKVGEKIVTGPYTVLRVLKNGEAVKAATAAELAPKSSSGS
jgi:HlyD family secretion protein